eukprot:scaffold216542_cov54-Prasinocladus_malaysianus.AAC.1
MVLNLTAVHISPTLAQTACLVLSTHQTLLPYIKNEEVSWLCSVILYSARFGLTEESVPLIQEVMRIIQGQMGAATSPLLKYVCSAGGAYLLKGTLYFSRDSFASMASIPRMTSPKEGLNVGRLHTLRSDFGGSVDAVVNEGDG